MNSLSRTNNNNSPCHGKSRENNSVFLKCGSPGSASLTPLAVATPPALLSSVTVDTEGLNCPVIKLDFTANISVPVAALALGTFTFQVYRIQNNQFIRIPVGPAWTYTVTVGLISSESFNFFVCDCSVCDSDCTTYIVEVTSPLVAVGTVNITNATLSALVVEGSSCC